MMSVKCYVLQRSVGDAGCQHIERFLAQAPHYIKSDGRINR